MCGIVAVTGYKNALPLLFNGLEKLEYRGYCLLYTSDAADE